MINWKVLTCSSTNSKSSSCLDDGVRGSPLNSEITNVHELDDTFLGAGTVTVVGQLAKRVHVPTNIHTKANFAIPEYSDVTVLLLMLRLLDLNCCKHSQIQE